MLNNIPKITLKLTILVLIYFCFITNVQSKSTKVLFINPGKTGETFWTMVSNFMEAAAYDLNIQLKITYSERDMFKMLRIAENAIINSDKPDYTVVVNEKNTGSRLLKILAPHTNVIFINNSLGEAEESQFRASSKFSSKLVSSLTPDHFQAGKDIANHIIMAARKQNKIDEIGIIAIGGNKRTPASILRVNGLKSYSSFSPNIKIFQIIYSQWRRANAEAQITGLLRRWPNVRGIWAANDDMALGAIDALEKTQLKPGVDVFVGGLNCSKEGLKNVLSKKMITTVGGHFMLGGWSLVLINDHSKGLSVPSNLIIPMMAINQKNIKTWNSKFETQDWNQIEFSSFTMHKNKNTVYDFSLSSILK